MKFTYADDEVQYAYNPIRSAIGEWVKGHTRWLFMGWLYEGQVTTWEKAVELTAEYLSIGK